MDFSQMLEDDEPAFSSMLEGVKENYKLWPTSGVRTALIDADLLPYKVGFTIDEMDEFSAKKTVAEGYADSIMDTDQCKDAINQLDWLINRWVTSSGCDSAKLYLTDAPNQFRHDLAISEKYKGKRDDTPKPPFFYELKMYLVHKHNAIVATDNEADDMLSIELNKENTALLEQGVEIGSQTHRDFHTKVLVSIDKDLRITSGMHFNPDVQAHTWVEPLGYLEAVYSKKEINVYEYWPTIKAVPINLSEADPRWALVDRFQRGAKKGTHKLKRVLIGTGPSSAIDKLKGSGLKFFYSQLITGDDVDCYSGLKGSGKTAAFNLLDSAKSEQELFDRVLNAYRDHYGDEVSFKDWRGRQITAGPHQLLAEQGCLAWMQQFDKDFWPDRWGLTCPWFDKKKHGFK